MVRSGDGHGAMAMARQTTDGSASGTGRRGRAAFAWSGLALALLLAASLLVAADDAAAQGLATQTSGTWCDAALGVRYDYYDSLSTASGQRTFNGGYNGALPSGAHPAVAYNFQAIEPFMTTWPHPDARYTNLALGFTFDYFDQQYTTIEMGINGLAYFIPGTTPNTYDNRLWASTTSPNGIIAPLWSDYVGGNGNLVYYGPTGTAGSQVFFATWDDLQPDPNHLEGPFPPSTPSYRFQIKLFEADDSIEVHYDYSGQREAPQTVVGLETPSGSQAMTIKARNDQTSGWDSYALKMMRVADRAPVAKDDTKANGNTHFTTLEDTKLVVTAGSTSTTSGFIRTSGLMANDQDELYCDTKAVVLDTAPAKGTLTLASDGSFEYVPDADWYGTDSFKYKVSDGTFTSNVATVEIVVTPVNDAPVFTIPAGLSELPNAGARTITGFATGIHAGGVSYRDGQAPDTAQTLTFTLTPTDASKFSQAPAIDPATGTLTFTLASGACGAITVQAVLADNGGTADNGKNTSGPQSFTINVPCNDAPVADDLDVVLLEDGVKTFRLPATDTEDPVTALTFAVASPPAGLDATSLPDVTYRPATDLCTPSAPLSFSYTATDTKGASDSGTVRITVTCVNDAPRFDQPLADPPLVYTTDGARTLIGFAKGIHPGGGSDESGQAIQFEVVSSSDPGILDGPPTLTRAPSSVSGSTATLSYAPLQAGQTTVCVRAIDDGGQANLGMDRSHVDGSAGACFTIRVAGGDDPPQFIGLPASVTLLEDHLHEMTVQAVDPEGATTTLRISRQPTMGIATLDAAGKLRYVPSADRSGIDSVELEACDPQRCAQATITYTVQAVNDAPTITSIGQDVAVVEDGPAQSVPSFVKASPGPSDEVAQTITFVVTPGVAPDWFTMAPAIDTAGTLRFHLAPDVCGTIALTVRAKDSGGTQNNGFDTSQSVVRNIVAECRNDPPGFDVPATIYVDEDAATMAVGTITSLTAGPREDAQGQTVTVTIALAPGGASLFSQPPVHSRALNGLSFVLAPDVCGETMITITAKDSGGTAHGAVDTVHKQAGFVVRCVNDPPTGKLAPVQVLEDANGGAILSVPGFLAEVTAGGGVQEAWQKVTATLAFAGDDGEGNVAGILSKPALAAGTLSFKLQKDGCGEVPGTVTLQDNGDTLNGGQTTSVLPFTVRVQCVNDAPTFTEVGNAFVIVGETAGAERVSRLVKGIRMGGPDEHDQQRIWTIEVGKPELFQGDLALDRFGTLTFTPTGVFGRSTIKVCLRDDGGTENGGIEQGPCKVGSVTVQDLNDAPYFVPGPAVEVDEDSGAFTMDWASGIDAGGPTESWQSVHFTGGTDVPALFKTLPAITPEGVLTFEPAPDANGVATVLVRLHDDGGTAKGGQDKTTPFPLRITIRPVNDAPRASDDVFVVAEDSVLEVPAAHGVLANDVDVEGDAVKATLLDKPRHGLLEFAPDGSFRYTPATDFAGTDQFRYEARDVLGAGKDAFARIQVVNVNDLPVAAPDYYSLMPDTPLIVLPDQSVLRNDVDVDGEPLRAALLQGVSQGTLDLKEDGSFVYIPAPGFSGADMFVYRALDASGGTSLGSNVHLRVQDNAPPVAAFDIDGSPVAGNSLRFVDRSRDPDGSGVSPTDGKPVPAASMRSWLWEFGDGARSHEPMPSHAYAQPGTYAVRLTVTDQSGGRGTATRELRVHPAGGEGPNLDAGPDLEVIEGHVIPLVAVAAPDVALAWTQTSGPTVALLAPTEARPAVVAPILSGELEPVRLTFRVTGSVDGRQSSDDVVVKVVRDLAKGDVRAAVTAGAAPPMEKGLPWEALEGQKIVLGASVRGFAGAITWTQTGGPVLGLGTVAGPTASVVTPVGVAGTTYVFTATATDGQRTVRDHVAVRVVPPVSEGTIKAQQMGRQMHFLAMPGSQHVWHLGDGNKSTQLAPVHEYAAPGTYDVYLEMSGLDGRLQRHHAAIEVADTDASAAPDETNSEGGGLGPGAVVAIAVGAMALAGIAAAIVVRMRRR